MINPQRFELLFQCFLYLSLFVTNLSLVHDGKLLIRFNQIFHKVLWFIVGHKQTATKCFKALSEFLHWFQLKSCPHYPWFAIHLVLWNTHVVKSWIKAVQRDKLNVFDFLLHCPIKDRVVMDSQVISEPQNHSILYMIWLFEFRQW